MRGIFGVMDFSRMREPEAIDRRMMAAMFHRGPDDENLLIDLPVALAMQRLSIIDLAGGRQPEPYWDFPKSAIINPKLKNPD